MRRLRNAAPRAAAIVSAALLVPVPGAGAQEALGLRITPAQVEPAEPIDDRRYDGTIVYTNNEDVEYRVELSVAELGHDLDGAAVFIPSEAHAEAFSLGTESFEIGPGERRDVAVEGSIPRDRRAIYVGIVAGFAPVDQAAGTTVEQRSRIAAQYLLRGPQPWDERVKVVDVGLLPAEGDALRVYASLRNVGDVHVKPRGYIDIFSDGVRLDRVELEGGGEGRVLPGYARRLSGLWTPPDGLDGKITLTARIFEPAARGTRTVDFSEGETPTPAAEIRNFVARPRDGGLVSLELVNTGPITIEPAIELTATEANTQRARRVIPLDRPLRSGKARAVKWSPGLPDGIYTITARAREGDVLLDEATAGLVLGAAPQPGVIGARGGLGWLRWLALVLILLLVAFILFMLWRRSRERNQDEAQQVPTRTAAR